MSEYETDHHFRVVLLGFLLVITGRLVLGDSLENDKQTLLNLKAFLEEQNLVNRGIYTQWNLNDLSPCNWLGISCDSTSNRVTGINLSDNKISGNMFRNFSALTELSSLDLSKNSISGISWEDLGQCRNLKALNLSYNIIDSEMNSNGFNTLENLDLSYNRIRGDIGSSFSRICISLVVANISSNNFTGDIGSTFSNCSKLKYLDLSLNHLVGSLWNGVDRLNCLSIAQNNFSGSIPSWIFTENCSFQALDLSENLFSGEFPKQISYCQDLEMLTLWGNKFTGPIPREVGSILKIKALYLGNNNFSSNIPETLLGLSKLEFLDLSKNDFRGDIQEIFGRLTQVKFLLLHGNSYTGGINSSGILSLPNIVRLDLSYNNFSGPLPVEFSQMATLKFLILAYNRFTGSIPSMFGNFRALQALDLSFNNLNGTIPPSLGNLKSLLWLMLANNSLTGEIPRELGNCSSLLWINLENNQLSGNIPPEFANIGANATPTFMLNRETDEITAGSGECLAMRRWIPEDYPPFSFVYALLTRKHCRNLWNKLLKGYGLFPVCVSGRRQYAISGYVQLSGNRFSGEIPREIGKMQNFSMLQLAFNEFSGELPLEVGLMPLIVLNVTRNKFSGEIPSEIGNIKCLQNLDLSYNNFSGAFPASFSNLTDLNKFNISYNPYISGDIPETGQLSTFEKWSFVGDPLLNLPSFVDNSTDKVKRNNNGGPRRPRRVGSLLSFFALVLAFLLSGIMVIVVCLIMRSRDDTRVLSEDEKGKHGFVINSDTMKVIHLDKTSFTYVDILKATHNFSDERIVGRGGFGIVYRGVLPDGREVAVKKLQREGLEGEKEFQAEMEALTGNGFGWPHPNLVTLYGWCLDWSEKLLVYEYMEGGTLEDLITDKSSFSWTRRLDVAIDVARALVFLHHECVPCIVHRDVKASNVLLDKEGRARVTDFGLARIMEAGNSHVSTMVAGTVGYVAPEYIQTWQATTKGDVYSYGVLALELATRRRAVDGGDESLVEWSRRIMGDGAEGYTQSRYLAEGDVEMCELLQIGIRCTDESPQARPNMKEVLHMLLKVLGSGSDFSDSTSAASSMHQISQGR